MIYIIGDSHVSVFSGTDTKEDTLPQGKVPHRTQAVDKSMPSPANRQDEMYSRIQSQTYPVSPSTTCGTGSARTTRHEQYPPPPRYTPTIEKRANCAEPSTSPKVISEHASISRFPSETTRRTVEPPPTLAFFSVEKYFFTLQMQRRLFLKCCKHVLNSTKSKSS